MDRRIFLQFMGQTSALGVAVSVLPSWSAKALDAVSPRRFFSGLPPSSEDALLLTEGLNAQVFLRWGDVLNSQGEQFGFNSDFTAFVPFQGRPQEGILWVNHEYSSALFVGGSLAKPKSQDQVEREMKSVGGSLVHIKRSPAGEWRMIQDSPYNRRLDAFTSIPMTHEVDGTLGAIGTLANCAGGVTPWGTVLSCEENYQFAFGEYKYDESGAKTLVTDEKADGWQNFYPRSPEHYGWVVEINPFTGDARKLIALGRFCHEGATTTRAQDGRIVVYMGDDASDECVYKFISHSPDSLESGVLYVADTVNGRWLPLDLDQSPILQTKFRTQTEVLVRAREAAKLVGGTPQDRPEDIKINPATGDVIVAMTNNKANKNLYGQLLKIQESDSDPLSLTFTASVMLYGGPETGLACPDNMIFDRHGNLWVTNDISSSSMGKGDYAQFKNNGLYVIPMSGPSAGEVFQVASGPVDAELTGPSFSPDGETLFLCVQHPGEETKDLSALTSTWPDGGIPKSAVVAIRGPLLDNPALLR